MMLRSILLSLAFCTSTAAFAGNTYNAEGDFTGTQGNRGWYYLYDALDDGSYVEMSLGTNSWGNSTLRDASCTEAIADVDPSYGFIMHTASLSGCSGATAVGWEASGDGHATISIDAGTVNSACSGGSVDIELVDDSGTVLADVIGTTHLSTYSLGDTVAMAPGDMVYLQIHAGTNSWCDSTGVDFDITFNEVANFSFEAADGWDLSHNTHNWNHSMLGWDQSSGTTGGTQDPGLYLYNSGSIPDGDYVAWLNQGSFFQEAVASVDDGEVYTLTADIGWRLDEAAPGDGTMKIAIDGTVVASVALSGQSKGDFVKNSVSYTTTSADAGKPLSVIFEHDGAWPTDGQINIDNVQLSVD